jgi:hypothetical protein
VIRVESLLVMAALGFWSAMLVQRGIAVFHDGLRPAMGEFAQGSISREQLAQTSLTLNQTIAVWFVPFMLATGVVLTHVLLLPLELVGVRTRTWPLAGVLGALWGVALVILVTMLRTVLSALPVNIPDLLFASLTPLLYAVIIIPPVAVAYQFGLLPGVVSLIAVLIGYVINLNAPAIGANVLPTLTGLLALVFYTWRAEMKRRAVEGAAAIEGFETQAARIKQHLPYLAIEGALVGLAVNLGLFSWYGMDMNAAAHDFRAQAALVTLTITIGFLPTVITSELLTGVSQAVGLTLVFTVAYLAPHPLIAAVVGATVMSLEALYLERFGTLLNNAPTIREVGDSVRGALERVSSVALIGGALMVSDRLLPGGGGYLIVGSVIAINELTGTRIIRMGQGPVAVLIAGIVANILYVGGVR